MSLDVYLTKPRKKNYYPTPWRYDDEYKGASGCPAVVDAEGGTVCAFFWPAHPAEETAEAEALVKELADILIRASWNIEENDELYDANITHNLGKMADAAGIYKHLWRPEEIGITKAEQLIEPLTEGLARLRAEPAHFQQFNAENGWGIYNHFVPFVENYLNACKESPDADVRVSH